MPSSPLPQRPTPPPHLCASPVRNAAIHNTVPVVQAVPPHLRDENKITLLKLQIMGTWGGEGVGGKEGKEENTLPCPARSHRWKQKGLKHPQNPLLGQLGGGPAPSLLKRPPGSPAARPKQTEAALR